MTEEEKKVFMKIKDRHKYFTRDDKFEETNDFEKECLFEIGYLTQIIEKLQKENEEKDKKILGRKFYEVDLNELLKENYIPKDKIRELIKNKLIKVYDSSYVIEIEDIIELLKEE